jgi:hypothetical protein
LPPWSFNNDRCPAGQSHNRDRTPGIELQNKFRLPNAAKRMNEYPGPTWLSRYRERVNADRELSVIGDWFTTTFALTFGDARYALKVEKGKIVDIIDAPKLDVRTIFGFRAPVAVWQKFLSPDPPPLYHDFFAMLMRVPEFTLEGDSLAAMQNARALHRMMNIMRETGAPDA